MGLIDHGHDEGMRLQLQRELPNGQWSALGIRGDETLLEDAAGFHRKYPRWNMRVRITDTRYVTVEEFASGSAERYPLPVDLIVAARDLIAAYGGDVPDWLQMEVGMLELALKPFEGVALPQPAAPPVAEGDEMPIRRLEQREGAELHTLVTGFWNIFDEALGLDQMDGDEGDRIVSDMMKRNIDEDDPAALVTVRRDGKIAELWASDRYPDSEGVTFTCVWTSCERGHDWGGPPSLGAECLRCGVQCEERVNADGSPVADQD